MTKMPRLPEKSLPPDLEMTFTYPPAPRRRVAGRPLEMISISSISSTFIAATAPPVYISDMSTPSRP